MSITYEDWKLDLFTFDPYWQDDGATELWQTPASLTFEYITRLFTESGPLLDDNTPEELERILWTLLNDIMLVQPENMPPASAGIAWIESMKILFRDLYNPHCLPVLGHLDEQPTSPLNSSCYMWWDILPVWHSEAIARAQINRACLDTMTYCLSLENLACQESALHGLGHWQSEYPEEVIQIIEGALDLIPDQLQPYALQARRGCVL